MNMTLVTSGRKTCRKLETIACMKDTDRWEIEELAHRAMGKTDTQADQAISRPA